MKSQIKHPVNEKAGLPVWLLGFFLVAVTLIAYQPVWHAGFIWDDDNFLTDNPVIKSADGLYRMWFAAATPDYFPMTSSLLWLEWRIWGNHPFGYHLVNVLLHAFSAVLLWRVLQRLKIPGALLAAALFAVHPVNVESVAWITERKNTLAMFFFVVALLSWLKFEDSGRGRWYGLALAAFMLSLLSKTAAAPLPLVLLGLAWWRRGRVGWKDVGRVVPFFVIAAVLALVTVWFQNHRAIGHTVIRTDGFWSRLAGAGWAVWFYLYKAVLPLNLAFVYPRWQINARNVLSYIPLVMLTVVFVLCWHSRRDWGKALFFGLAYFVVMLLPILGFFNIYFMRYSLVADHWEYFAIIGPIVLAAAIIRKPVVAAALLLALGALTWKQCGMYANTDALWLKTLGLNPVCWLAHNNLGVALDQEGRTDEAIARYQAALQIKPDYMEARYNLGSALLQKGKVDEAIYHFQKALAIKPDFAEDRNNLGHAHLQMPVFAAEVRFYLWAHNNLGNALLQKGRLDEAIAQFQKALAIQPAYAEARYNLGRIFGQQGRLDEAIAQFQEALQSNPDYAEAHNSLGNAFLQKGRLDEAIAQHQKALQIKPDYTEAHNNLGNALLDKGRVDEAILQYQKALAIQPDYAEAHYNLGRIFGQQRRLDEAIAQFQKALAIQPDYAEANYNLGIVFAKQGKTAEAITQYRRALQIKPANPETQNNLAWLLATCREASLRNGKEAVELARRANELTGGGNPIILHTLAAALAETRQFDDAVQSVQKAIDLARAAGHQDLARQLDGELQRYKAGLPLHQ